MLYTFMEFNLKMVIHQAAALLNIFLFSFLCAGDCTYSITEDYFNDTILSHHITMLDVNLAESQPILYKYKINTYGICSDDLSINIEYKIIAPEIGIKTFETFFTGSINLETSQNYFTNNGIQSGYIPNISGNKKMATLISYISQTGKLPNGNYIFYFSLNSDTDILYTTSKVVAIQAPLALELLYPGGTLTELPNTYTNSTVPLFTWYSDFCPNCEFAIRICEYNQDYHASLEDALSNWSLVPMDQSNKFLTIGWNTNSYQYPSVGHIGLEVGKYYAWQIKRSFDTTLGIQHDYSPINVFEVRTPDKSQLDYSDPYLSVIEAIIGEEQFYLWFSPGGDLERYTTAGDAIYVNDETIHIDGLYSILSDLKQNKISIQDVSIK